MNQHSFDAQIRQFNTRNIEGYLPDGVITNVVLAVVDAAAVVVGEAVTDATEFLVHPVQQLNNRTNKEVNVDIFSCVAQRKRLSNTTRRSCSCSLLATDQFRRFSTIPMCACDSRSNKHDKQKCHNKITLCILTCYYNRER